MLDEKFEKWYLKENNLENLNPTKVRELLIECFYEVQRQTFKMVKQKTGVTSTDKDLYKSVAGAIKLAFAKMGGDFNNPTKESLLMAVAYIAKQAATWGTPQDVIKHNRKQIERAIALLDK